MHLQHHCSESLMLTRPCLTFNLHGACTHFKLLIIVNAQLHYSLSTYPTNLAAQLGFVLRRTFLSFFKLDINPFTATSSLPMTFKPSSLPISKDSLAKLAMLSVVSGLLLAWEHPSLLLRPTKTLLIIFWFLVSNSLALLAWLLVSLLSDSLWYFEVEFEIMAWNGSI